MTSSESVRITFLKDGVEVAHTFVEGDYDLRDPYSLVKLERLGTKALRLDFRDYNGMELSRNDDSSMSDEEFDEMMNTPWVNDE